MAESDKHKNLKKKAAGEEGKTETPISGDRKLDAVTGNTAIEMELSGNFKDAAKRLKDSGKAHKILQVPNNDMEDAVDAMRKAGVKGVVMNTSRTKKIIV